MRLSYYFVLIFTLQLGLYLIGYQAPLVQMFTLQGGQFSPDFLLKIIANAVTSDSGVVTLLTIAGLALASYFLGFSAMFLIPLAILIAISNLFVFPTQFFLGASCGAFAPGTTCTPPFFMLPLWVVFNLLVLLAYLEFVRGAS